MAEDQSDIVAITEVNPKGRSYKIEDIKIRDYITFESNLRCGGRRGVAVLVHSSLEHLVSALETNTEFQESLWLNFKLQNGDNLLFGNVYRSPISSEENDGALNLVMGKMCSPAPGRFSHICVVGDFNFILEPNKKLITTEVTMKMPDKSCRRSLSQLRVVCSRCGILLKIELLVYAMITCLLFRLEVGSGSQTIPMTKRC